MERIKQARQIRGPTGVCIQGKVQGMRFLGNVKAKIMHGQRGIVSCNYGIDHFNTNNRDGGVHSDDEYEEDIDGDDDALSFEKSSYYEYTETYQSVSEADDVAPCASQSMKKNVSKYSRI